MKFELFDIKDDWIDETGGPFIRGTTFGCSCCAKEYTFKSPEEAIKSIDDTIFMYEKYIQKLKRLQDKINTDSQNMVWNMHLVGYEVADLEESSCQG